MAHINWNIIINLLGAMSGMVHTRVEVHGMDSEMSKLVEQSWLQLMCCTVVTTSDDGEKSEMEVSADWCVAVEYQRSSSIKDYLH